MSFIPYSEKDLEDKFTRYDRALAGRLTLADNISSRIVRGVVTHNVPTPFTHNLDRDVSGSIILHGRCTSQLVTTKGLNSITLKVSLVSANIVNPIKNVFTDLIEVSDATKFMTNDIVTINGKILKVLSVSDNSLKLDENINTYSGSEVILHREKVVILIL